MVGTSGVVGFVKVGIETLIKLMEESSKESESAREKQAVKKKLSYNYGEQLPMVIAVFGLLTYCV